jgi:hypothetical protein
MTANLGCSYDNLFTGNNRPPQTLADSIRAYAANGEVMSVRVADLIDEDWTGAVTAKWDVLAGTAVVGSYNPPGAIDLPNFQGVELTTAASSDGERSMILSKSAYAGGKSGHLRVFCPQHANASGHHIYFRADDLVNAYIFFVEPTGCGFMVQREGDEVSLSTIDGDFGDAHLMIDIYWWEQRYSTLDDESWLFATALVDGRVIISMVDRLSEGNDPGTLYGLGATNGSARSAYFTGLEVTSFGEIDLWSALDPGNAPLSALSGIMEGRNIRLMERYDGSLSVWKPVARTSVWTVPESEHFRVTRNLDRNQIVTHMRMVGAFDHADYTDEIALGEFGHKFQLDHNSYLMNKAECLAAARLGVQRSMEQADTVVVVGPIVPFLEAEDVITTVHGDYIINSISIGLDVSGGQMTIVGRRYIASA